MRTTRRVFLFDNFKADTRSYNAVILTRFEFDRFLQVPERIRMRNCSSTHALIAGTHFSCSIGEQLLYKYLYYVHPLCSRHNKRFKYSTSVFGIQHRVTVMYLILPFTFLFYLLFIFLNVHGALVLLFLFLCGYLDDSAVRRTYRLFFLLYFSTNSRYQVTNH